MTLIKSISPKKCKYNMTNSINNNNFYDLYENKLFKFLHIKVKYIQNK